MKTKAKIGVMVIVIGSVFFGSSLFGDVAVKVNNEKSDYDIEMRDIKVSCYSAVREWAGGSGSYKSSIYMKVPKGNKAEREKSKCSIVAGSKFKILIKGGEYSVDIEKTLEAKGDRQVIRMKDSRGYEDIEVFIKVTKKSWGLQIEVVSYQAERLHAPVGEYEIDVVPQ